MFYKKLTVLGPSNTSSNLTFNSLFRRVGVIGYKNLINVYLLFSFLTDSFSLYGSQTPLFLHFKMNLSFLTTTLNYNKRFLV